MSIIDSLIAPELVRYEVELPLLQEDGSYIDSALVLFVRELKADEFEACTSASKNSEIVLAELCARSVLLGEEKEKITAKQFLKLSRHVRNIIGDTAMIRNGASAPKR